MRKTSAVITRKVLDTTLLLPMRAGKDGLWAYEMNAGAAVLWDHIHEEATPESLAEKLAEHFEISADLALRDTNEFLAEMRAIGALE